MKTYQVAPEEVTESAAAVIEKHYPEITESGLVIEYQFANSDSGPAVSVGGWPCNASIKIIGLQDRVAGRGDAIVTIDQKRWDELTEENRVALLDHELYHLICQREDDGAFKKDGAGRPKLKMRPHDVEVGWFKEVAIRNGEHSMEVKGARAIFDEHGQAFFPWLLTLEAKPEKPAKAPKAKKGQPPASEVLDPAA